MEIKVEKSHSEMDRTLETTVYKYVRVVPTNIMQYNRKRNVHEAMIELVNKNKDFKNSFVRFRVKYARIILNFNLSV